MIHKTIHIGATGIVLRYIGRIKRKRIADIRVLMVIISLHLPCARNVDQTVTRTVIFWRIKRLLERIDTAVIMKLPSAI